MANKSEESNWTKQIYPCNTFIYSTFLKYRNISTESIINITGHETEECKDFDIQLPVFEIFDRITSSINIPIIINVTSNETEECKIFTLEFNLPVEIEEFTFPSAVEIIGGF
ncbi:1879_t:CDS:2, partial [Dentiscutata heterogama]